MNNKTLYVAGKFDDLGGRPSKLAHQVFEAVNIPASHYVNGGYFKNLEQIINNISKYKLIYWFADIPNDKPKLVRKIKPRNKACVLVTSKRNLENKYALHDIIYRALSVKSNLFVEFSKRQDRYHGRVIDPLGNVFLDYTDDFELVGKVLGKRTKELLNYTRIPSKSIGDRLEVPDEERFFELIKQYAGTFHKLIHSHPEAANRFFGNASFRCERGFPSFKDKDNGIIYVSRRNIDKRFIGPDGFVGVRQDLPVEYFGVVKPSVDTPIQIKLYDYYPGLRYMLHSHVYVKDAPFTNSIIPCGAVEEADEIINLYPYNLAMNFSVNLKGHGSVVLVNDVKHLENIEYIPRPMPELHELK